jgi:hypothetical protein
MTIRHEILISIFSIIIIFLTFSPLMVFLQDLAHGNVYFKYTYDQNNNLVVLTLVNSGTSYLKDIVYNATVIDSENNVISKAGHIDIFKKGDQIDIKIPMKIPHIIPVSVYLKLEATINGLYRLSFEVKKL